MSDDNPPLKEKINILFRNGFLRHEDRADIARVEARWKIYQQMPQQTFRSRKLREPSVVKPSKSEA